MIGCSGECCFGVMYDLWYGVRDIVVFSAIDVFVNYCGVYVFRVCFDLCLVYGVGMGAGYGGVCAVEWYIFL